MSGAGPVADSVLVGTGVNVAQNTARSVGERLDIIEHKHDAVREQLAEVNAHLKVIEKYVAVPPNGNIDHLEAFQDPVKVYVVNNKGRKYTAVFTPVSLAVIFTVRGLAPYNPTLQPGWSFLVFPDGSEMTVPSATAASPVNLLFLETDEQIGVAI